MSPATMCSLATSTARPYASRPIVERTSGSGSPGSGGSTRGSSTARAPSRPSWSSRAPAAASGERREGLAADEAPAAPALPVLHRLEQEPRLLAHHPQEGGDGGRQVGEHLPPDGQDGVLLGEGAELLAGGTQGHEVSRTT